MSDSFVFSKTFPINSIVNPDSDKSEYLDYENPYTFVDFIKNIDGRFSPKDYNNLYVEYLKEWDTKKNLIATSISDLIRDRYVNFLKDLTLNYSSTEEQRFLSNLDFNDELDIDVLIPFYSRKISQICNFYSERRDKLKFKIEKNKIKTTSLSIEKKIYESVTDAFFLDIIRGDYYNNPINYKNLLKNLKIEVEELYDLYDNYFDYNPKSSADKFNRNSQYFTENLNGVDINVFIDFDKAVAAEILGTLKVFLTEFGKLFTVNYNVDDVNLDCKPDEKLYNIIAPNKEKAKIKVSINKNLIEKYMGNNLFYFKTTDTITDYVSGRVIDSDRIKVNNILNTRYPTTATTHQTDCLSSERHIGGFFTPHKNGILYFSSSSKKFILNKDKITLQETYIIPDPTMYGNVIGLTNEYNSDYPFKHIEDYTDSIKNNSNFFVNGDIKNTPHRQDYHGYYSRNQIKESTRMGFDGLDFSFCPLYSKGILVNYKTDIFGNEYGLFKLRKKKSYVDNETEEPLQTKYCELYDGGPITFSNNKLLPEPNFISNQYWVYPNVWASNYYYNIGIEGGISRIFNGLFMQRPLFHYYSVDGLSIDMNPLTADGSNIKYDIWLNPDGDLDNSIFYDGTLYGDSQLNYVIINPTTSLLYDYIIDADRINAIYSNFNLQTKKILDGNPKNINPDDEAKCGLNYTNDLKRKDFDSGVFCANESDIDSSSGLFDFDDQTNFIVTKQVESRKSRLLDNSQGEYTSNYDFKESYGGIYVRNCATGHISHILSAISVQFYNYPQDVRFEIETKTQDFQLINDFIAIRTETYLIFERIKYSIDDFIYSGVSNNYVSNKSIFGGDFVYVLSDPFLFTDRKYCMYASLSVSKLQNSTYIIPKVFTVDYNSCEIDDTQKLDTNLNQFKLPPEFKNKILSIEKPILFYNSRNDRYGLATTIIDLNGNSYIYVYKFRYNDYNIHSESTSFYFNNSIVNCKLLTSDKLVEGLKIGSPIINPIIDGGKSIQ
jgi:hypothetical protein